MHTKAMLKKLKKEDLINLVLNVQTDNELAQKENTKNLSQVTTLKNKLADLERQLKDMENKSPKEDINYDETPKDSVKEVVVESTSYDNQHLGRAKFGGKKYTRTKTTFIEAGDTIKINYTYYSPSGFADRKPNPVDSVYELKKEDKSEILIHGFKAFCTSKFEVSNELQMKNDRPIKL